MRVMQERANEKRGEQYLLIKSPSASGKSRALMFIALDKLHNQGLKQAIIVVPEKSIGSSFADEPLSKFGFWADWKVSPRWNLCNSPGTDGGNVNSVGAFLESSDRVLVCTHATFRFSVERFGVEAFDDRLIAIDEFHHVSANPDNKLGGHLGSFMTRDKAHIVAMTGSYFRGDAEAVLMPTDEAKFETVTYTYYEQLNGSEHLKNLDIGYFFYNGPYVDDILRVLDAGQKTILHIPNVNTRESTKDKHREVEHILDALGEWQGTDPVTGFQLVKVPDGRVLRIADLVDDEGPRRDRVSAALKDPAQKMNRDHVDIIIALGMAKEGFDWIWCEHALTVGYRASLTEVVQIIGRATRDAPGKVTARFTNLIAEPDASEGAVTEAVNDTLKAIAASLLMEQVLAPRFEFKPKTVASTAELGFDYGEAGYDPTKCNVGFNPTSGKFQIEIKGLAEPKSEFAHRICISFRPPCFTMRNGTWSVSPDRRPLDPRQSPPDLRRRNRCRHRGARAGRGAAASYGQRSALRRRVRPGLAQPDRCREDQAHGQGAERSPGRLAGGLGALSRGRRLCLARGAARHHRGREPYSHRLCHPQPDHLGQGASGLEPLRLSLALREAVSANADRFAKDLRPVLQDIRAGGNVSLRTIAAELDKRGMCTRRGGQWQVSNVRDLLGRLEALAHR